jgi:hypothetical protein
MYVLMACDSGHNILVVLSTYRVMSDVLPTDWSPRRTIFVRFSGEEVKSAVWGVEGVAILAVN